jgi:prepilin-type N-terminal cleavage/methylation domain-containing protein/prepilin-type processing-associated H-X9-DG protein
MNRSASPARRTRGFTLLELLLVISIIAILASLLMPAIGVARQKADSIVCANNLKTIGASVQLYLGDHSNMFPCIEPVVTGSGSQIYSSYTNIGTVYQSMVDAFGPYGVTQKTIQCPSDVKSSGSGSYGAYGTSYDWRPTLDDENSSEPLIYGRRMMYGAQTSSTSGVIVKLSKVRQAYDDTPIHFGHMNALYADGHVVGFTASGH